MELNDNQKRDLEFVDSSFKVEPVGPHIHDNWDTKFLPIMEQALDSGNKNILWLHREETFTEQHQLDFLYDKIKKYPDKNIKIMCSTTSHFHLGIDPLVNIYQWGDTRTRSNISWLCDTEFHTLARNNFLTNNDKEIKGIISWRKGTIDRRDVYNSEAVQNKFQGIKRYANWHSNPNNEKEIDYGKINQFPTLYQLIQEYNKSYVSFVFETESSYIMNQFSEKILMSFLSKTMPIVYGGKGMIQELKNMGLKVWNDEFGFDDTTPYHHNKRSESYINCIKKYNEMSFNDIKKMYDRHRDDIENNFKIVSWFINRGGFQ